MKMKLTNEQLSELERLVVKLSNYDLDTLSRSKLFNHAKALIAEVKEAREREAKLERITKADGIYSERIGWDSDGSPRWGVRYLGWEHKEFSTRSDCDDAIIAAYAKEARDAED